MEFLWLDGIREIGQQEIMMMVHKGVIRRKQCV